MTHQVDEKRARRLREELADRLSSSGALRSPGWRDAILSVPRHLFVPSFFRRSEGSHATLWTPVSPASVGANAWLEEAYADDTLVTQLDGGTHPEDVDGPVTGDPTSSSTLPSLVIRMLEDLGVQSGNRVLEIGTGTGYSTALMCHRLRSENVSSIEYDPAAARRAHEAIATAGYQPALVLGDGLAGHERNAPYDRLVATCSVRHIPTPWLRQVRPGGTILVTLSGWLYGSGLVMLTVGEGGTAEGGFLPGTVSFMIARPHAAPRLDGVSDLVARGGKERPTPLSPHLLWEWMPQFVAQLAAPETQYVGLSTDDGQMLDHLVDIRSGSFATLVPAADGDGWLVRQGGPVRLWDAVEEAVETWRRAGSPPQTEFGLSVNPSGQWVWLGSPEGPRWRLPSR